MPDEFDKGSQIAYIVGRNVTQRGARRQDPTPSVSGASVDLLIDRVEKLDAALRSLYDAIRNAGFLAMRMDFDAELIQAEEALGIEIDD